MVVYVGPFGNRPFLALGFRLRLKGSILEFGALAYNFHIRVPFIL